MLDPLPEPFCAFFQVQTNDLLLVKQTCKALHCGATDLKVGCALKDHGPKESEDHLHTEINAHLCLGQIFVRDGNKQCYEALKGSGH